MDSNTILVSRDGYLTFHNKKYLCSIGANGITQNKQEGDKSTPEGCFPIRYVLYRPDKIQSLDTKIPIVALEENDGWCDDVSANEYNTHIKAPFNSSYEKMWREDNLYDIVVVLGYNDDPVVAGKGSAIFMHIARENYSPTDGCVGLSKSDLLEILNDVDATTQVCIR